MNFGSCTYQRAKLRYYAISALTPMVQDAKSVAADPLDYNAAARWRESNKAVS